jgi:hypothetical protein
MLLIVLTRDEEPRILSGRTVAKVVINLGTLRYFSLSSWLAVTLLAVIAVMLIAPDVDPPDTALQGNTAPIAIHVVSHHVARGKHHFRPITIYEFSQFCNMSSLSCSSGEYAMVSSIPDQVLRC